MTLTLKGLSKNGKQAIYAGSAQNVRIPVGNFPDKTAPETIDVADGVFVAAKQPKVKLTAEERKAARANKPKPTLAEKLAAQEKKAAKLREQLAKEQGAQPVEI